MSLTKKNFVAIAEILAHNSADESMTRSFIRYFENQNPNFNEDRFLDYINDLKQDMENNK